MKTFLKTVNNAIKYWYIFLIIGILFAALGLYVFATPLKSFITLALFFSLSFIFSGLSEIMFASFNRKEVDNWGWILASGVISMLLGIIMTVRPEISMATLPFYIGFIVLFRSFMAISTAIDLQNYDSSNYNGLLLLGFLGLIFSFVMLWNPVFAGMTLVFWTGAALLSIGIYNIFLAFKLRRIHKTHQEISDELKEKLHQIKKEIHEELKDK